MRGKEVGERKDKLLPYAKKIKEKLSGDETSPRTEQRGTGLGKASRYMNHQKRG